MTIPTKIKLPPSKSISQRALYYNFLFGSSTKLINLSIADDVKIFYEIKNKILELSNNQKEVIINVNESGFWFRVLASSLPIYNTNFWLTGNKSLLKRDFTQLSKALLHLGIKITFSKEKFPVKVSGKLTSGNYIIDASFSSQHITGLLFALSMLNDKSSLHLINPVSIPYIHTTIKLLNNFNLKIEYNNKENTIYVFEKKKNSPPKTYYIENDWSAAAFFAVYASIIKPLTLLDLTTKSIQGDSIIAKILHNAGNTYTEDKKSITFYPGQQKSINVDLSNYPDLFPPLVVYSAFAKGTSILKGANRLINKESNRAKALVKELSLLGIDIKLINNNIVVKGQSKIRPSKLSSHNDHRIAMAIAIISAISKEKISIDNTDCVNKSFPNFFDEIKKLEQ